MARTPLNYSRYACKYIYIYIASAVTRYSVEKLIDLKYIDSHFRRSFPIVAREPSPDKFPNVSYKAAFILTDVPPAVYIIYAFPRNSGPRIRDVK